MARSEEQIEAELLALPLNARVRLAHALLASLDEEEDIEAAWYDEAERRIAEYRASGEEPMAVEAFLRTAGAGVTEPTPTATNKDEPDPQLADDPDDGMDPEIRRTWAAEALRRYEQIKRGEVELIDHEDVVAEMRARFGPRSEG